MNILEIGEQKGLEQVNELNRKLAELNRVDDILKAATDKEYQQKLFQEFGIKNQ